MDHRHTEANCAWNTTKPCNVRACYERHHISLHQTVTGRINVIQVIDLTLTDSLLPVMIYTFKDQEQTTTILFDSGSTVSLIEKSLASSLGLKGFPLTTILYKVCKTDTSPAQAMHYDVPMKDRSGSIYLIRMIGVEHICQPQQLPNFNNI